MAARKKKADEHSSKGTFDEGVSALEAVVAELESGELPLEKALESFEKGIALVRQLNERLNHAEKRIEVLSRGSEGELVVAPLDEGDGEE